MYGRGHQVCTRYGPGGRGHHALLASSSSALLPCCCRPYLIKCPAAAAPTSSRALLLQERGLLFCKPGDEVYEGQVVGQCPKAGDLKVRGARCGMAWHGVGVYRGGASWGLRGVAWHGVGVYRGGELHGV